MAISRTAVTRPLAGALALLAAGWSVELAAQRPEPHLTLIDPPNHAWQPALAPADSARVLSSARSEQSRFELVRRNNLPWAWDRGSGPCDERVGRFCLWYGDGDSKWQPPPDPEPVSRARERLIARLDTAAAVVPGDWWVAGQRIRYLLEAERTEDAVVAARACRSAEPGWCDALLGYAFHSAGDFVAADSAFSVALAAMPPLERGRWTDLSVLLEPDALRHYRRLSPEERQAFEARYWWLARPLFLLPGNDRRTEHLARHVIDRLQDRARQTEGISWGSDLRQLLVRYGAPAGWERIRPRTPGFDTGSMLTRYRSGSRHFDPSLRFVREPTAIAFEEWDLNERRARSGYAPRYAAPMEEPTFQVATFLRGDSAVVAAALAIEPDSLGNRTAADAALILWRDEAAEPLMDRARVGGTAAVLSLRVPAAPTVLSLEAFAEEEKRAARARFGLPLDPLPPHGLAVSDVLLLDGPGPLPDSLADAIPLTRASTAARSGERLGVYWEIYGLAPADLPLKMAVHLVDENAGWLRRAAVRAGLLGQQTPLTVHWREAPERPDPVLPRSLAVELPELNPGTYTLQITLTPRGREPLRASRRITVTD